MPFSRRRRRRSRRQTLRLTLSAEFAKPLSGSPDGGPGDMSDTDAVAPIPELPGAGETGAIGTNRFVESPDSARIGIYQFDFTRLLAQCFGSIAATSPPLFLPGYFRQIRFGRGYMTIKRVDTGANTYILSSAAHDSVSRTVIGTFQNGTKPLALDLHYIRLTPHESTWSQFLLNQRIFMVHPRRRTVRLMPNRSVTFSFTARRFRTPDYVSHTIRDYANIGAEAEQFRRCEIPGRSRSLGWIPTELAGYCNVPEIFPVPTNPNPGLGSGLWRIVSPTIAFMFTTHEESYGVFNTSSGSPPAFPNDVAVAPLTEPWITRSERCTVHLRDLARATLGANLGDGSPVAGVGKIFRVTAWNAAVTGSPNVVECFDPPRITSLQNTPGFGPLYRDGRTITDWLPSEVPLDTEVSWVPPQAALPVPAVGAKP